MTIISGGQSGADRAGLDAAREVGLAIGGWCPLGRWAEDGRIGEEYPLRETPFAEPAQRTEWNVRDSEGTLIVCRKLPLQGGTKFTAECCARYGKPLLVIELQKKEGVLEQFLWFVKTHCIQRLNVAGPRESQEPGIYAEAKALLGELFRAWRGLDLR